MKTEIKIHIEYMEIDGKNYKIPLKFIDDGADDNIVTMILDDVVYFIDKRSLDYVNRILSLED